MRCKYFPALKLNTICLNYDKAPNQVGLDPLKTNPSVSGYRTRMFVTLAKFKYEQTRNMAVLGLFCKRWVLSSRHILETSSEIYSSLFLGSDEAHEILQNRFMLLNSRTPVDHLTASKTTLLWWLISEKYAGSLLSQRSAVVSLSHLCANVAVCTTGCCSGGGACVKTLERQGFRRRGHIVRGDLRAPFCVNNVWMCS
jgi:hypothetical protein